MARANTKLNPFLGSLRSVAIAIGKREKINIVFEGTGAKTDGQTIYLPASLPADDTEIETMIRGYLDHEVGHIKHTDFSLPLVEIVLIHTLTNIVEDIRIEQKVGFEYPGCAVNLRELINYLKAKGTISFNPKADPIGAILMAISFGSRVKHLRNNLVEEADAYRTLAGKHLGQKALSVIDMAITKSGKLTSTLDARTLAEEIYESLKQIKEEQPPQPPEPQQSPDSNQDQDESDQQEEGEGSSDSDSDDSDDSVDGNESGDGNSDKGDQEDQSDAGSGSDQQDGDQQDNDSSANADGNGSDAEGNQDGQGQADGTEGNSQSDSDMASNSTGAGGQDDGNMSSSPEKPMSGPNAKQRQNIEKVLDASTESLEKVQGALDVAAQAADQINKETMAARIDQRTYQGDSSGNTGEVKEVQTGGRGDGGFIAAEARKTLGLRAKMAGLFQSTKLKRDNPQLAGHRLDRRVVHRIAAKTPDTRIFQTRRDKVADNTAIAILVDKSGSMSCQIHLATAAAFSVAKATESMPGVKCAVAGFPQSSGVVGLKAFDEKANAARFAIGASGGTPLDVALRWAGQKLWPRRENRKIVLVLTDGEPNDPNLAKTLVDLLIEHDIECYGIGIGEGTGYSVRNLFGEHSREIAGIEDLGRAMFDTIAAAVARR